MKLVLSLQYDVFVSTCDVLEDKNTLTDDDLIEFYTRCINYLESRIKFVEDGSVEGMKKKS